MDKALKIETKIEPGAATPAQVAAWRALFARLLNGAAEGEPKADSEAKKAQNGKSTG